MQNFSVLELLNLILAGSSAPSSPQTEEKPPVEEVEVPPTPAPVQERSNAYADFLTRHDRAVERAKGKK